MEPKSDLVHLTSASLTAESLSEAARDVLAERQRQVNDEGWTPAHDDQHGDGAMAVAAACYALADQTEVRTLKLWMLWEWTGWSSQWWKPKDKRRNLIRAAALLLAEIERMDRADATPKWKPCARCTTHDYCTNQLRGCDISESLEAGIAPIAAGVVTSENASPMSSKQEGAQQ